MDDYILLIMQCGVLLIIMGIIGMPLTVVAALFKKESELKWMIRFSIGAIFLGISILGIVFLIGGVGAFNA